MACGGCGKRNKIHVDLVKKFGDKGVLDLIERMKRARKNALIAKATGEPVEIANASPVADERSEDSQQRVFGIERGEK